MSVSNRRIYDLMTRIAVMSECVKLGEGAAFELEIRSLKEQVRALLKALKHQKMGDMTKVELSALILAISKLQGKTFTTYTARLNKFLHSYCNVDAALTKRVFATEWLRDYDPTADICDDSEAQEFFNTEEKSSKLIPFFGWSSIQSRVLFNALWSKIGNAVIPANGMTLSKFIDSFANSAQGAVLNGIRASWANDETIDEAVLRIVGNDKTGETGILDRIVTQGRAVINTTTQHVGTSVSAAVSSSLLAFYRWDSILDSRTTEICRRRNGEIFVFGEGPIPPAHINCRSHITAMVSNTDDTTTQTLYSWASSQPLAFRRAVFGDSSPSLANARPMTTEEFAAQTAIILS